MPERTTGVPTYNSLMSLGPIQKEVDEWISQFEEGYFPPLELLARLTEEVGELARALMHHYGKKRPKPGEDRGDISEEIADSIFVLVCLANSLRIDLDASLAAMMSKIRERDKDRWTRKRERSTEHGIKKRGRKTEGDS
jgi:NTP pyrophosphatase (non-canonical NTP hydrolase)